MYIVSTSVIAISSSFIITPTEENMFVNTCSFADSKHNKGSIVTIKFCLQCTVRTIIYCPYCAL